MTIWTEDLPIAAELAFGADPDGDPESWTFFDVKAAGHLLDDSVSITYGRSNESSSVSPMTVRLALNNVSGDYTPGNAVGAHYPNVRLGTPVRITVTLFPEQGGTQHVRFTGFVSEWRPSWPSGDISDESTGDEGWSRVEVVASGLLRRMTQGEEALQSPVRRSVLGSINDVIAYWPMEDGNDATQFASAVDDGDPMRFQGAIFPADEGGPPGSLPLPRFDPEGTDGGDPETDLGLAWFAQGTVGAGPLDDAYIVSGVAFFTQTQEIGYLPVIVWHTGSEELAAFVLSVRQGDVRLSWFDSDGVAGTSMVRSLSEPVDGQWIKFSVRIAQSGSNASINRPNITTLDGETLTTGGVSVGLTNTAINFPTRVVLQFPNGFSTTGDRWFGHIAVSARSSPGGPFAIESGTLPMRAYVGEEAAIRFVRLCAEEDVRCETIGTSSGMLSDIQQIGGITNPGTGQVNLLAGEVDIRIELSAFPEMFDDSVPNKSLILKANSNFQYDWFYDVSANDLNLNWNASSGQDVFAFAGTAPPQFLGGQKTAFRFTLEDSGGTDTTVTFWWAEDINAALVDWQQIGAPTNVVGTVGFEDFAPDEIPITIGRSTGALIHRAQIRDGIDGTLVADVDLTGLPTGTDSFTDDSGNVWTVQPTSKIFESFPAPGETPEMGPQLFSPLTANLQDCADVDAGIFGETLDTWGLLFRTRHSLYNQEPILELDASEGPGEIENPFSPILDDQAIRNDVTVERPEGSTARLVDQQHIDEHGKYDTSVTVNVETDGQLTQQAAWRLALGTVPGMRYPSLAPALSQVLDLLPLWVQARLGDRVRVTNLPPQHPADGVDVLIQGWSEAIQPLQWSAIANAAPASPYAVWQLEPDPGSPAEGQRLATAGATLDAAITDTATSFDVVTQSGSQPWINSTDHAGQFPFSIVVGGEEIQVDSITGATSPQTFGVTRSINGVSKSHSAGADVQVKSPYKLAL
jgi:hypothetical protein